MEFAKGGAMIRVSDVTGFPGLVTRHVDSDFRQEVAFFMPGFV